MSDKDLPKKSKQKKQRRAITHENLDLLWDDLVGTSGHTKAHVEFTIDISLIERINALTGWKIDEEYVFAPQRRRRQTYL
ncbi:MAG: hypothetical protein QM811_25135 [Pirellulales bacterium]